MGNPSINQSINLAMNQSLTLNISKPMQATLSVQIFFLWDHESLSRYASCDCERWIGLAHKQRGHVSHMSSKQETNSSRLKAASAIAPLKYHQLQQVRKGMRPRMVEMAAEQQSPAAQSQQVSFARSKVQV
ncbi:MAG: hypothetical protein OIF54_16095 [Cohaesibacter sp.]|nr:hypothetical protein [Cohaesibacter sp.]